MLSDYIGYWPSVIVMVIFMAAGISALYKLERGKWPWERK
jgi:hypothetical protein